MWFIHTSPSSPSFQPSHSLGSTFPVCERLSAALLGVSGALARFLVMTQHAGEAVCYECTARRRKGKEEGRVFALQQLLFSPHPLRASHSSWKSLNYAASMTQRSKWLSDETGCVLWRSFSANCHQTCCELGLDFCTKSQLYSHLSDNHYSLKLITERRILRKEHICIHQITPTNN